MEALDYIRVWQTLKDKNGNDVLTKSGFPIKTGFSRKIPHLTINKEEALAGDEAIKENALSKATVQTSTGKWFYADSASRSDISDAIGIAVENELTSNLWKLAEPINGEKWNIVTLEELREARLLGLQLKGSIIGA